jgi:hypothetical protein
MPSGGWIRYFGVALLAACGGPIDAGNEHASQIQSEGSLGNCSAMSQGSADGEAAPTPSGCAAKTTDRCWLAVPDAGFSGRALPRASRSLTVWVSLVPSAANLDAVIGMSAGAAMEPADLAVALRFNPDAAIVARNAGVYAAVNPMNYGVESAYRVTFVLDVIGRTYSAWINERLLAENYALSGAPEAALDRFMTAVDSNAGALRACDFAASADNDSPDPAVASD